MPLYGYNATQTWLGEEGNNVMWARYTQNPDLGDNGFKDRISFRAAFNPSLTGVTYPATMTGYYDIEAYNTTIYPVPIGLKPFLKTRISFSMVCGLDGGVPRYDTPTFEVATEVIDGVRTIHNSGLLQPPAAEVRFHGLNNIRFGPWPCLIPPSGCIIRTEYEPYTEPRAKPYLEHRNELGKLVGAVADWEPIADSFFGPRGITGKVRVMARGGQRTYFNYINGRQIGGSSSGDNFPFPSGEFLTQWNMIILGDASLGIGFKRLVSGQYEMKQSYTLIPLKASFVGDEVIFTTSELRYFSLIKLRTGEMAAAAAGTFDNGGLGLAKILFKLRTPSGWPTDSEAIEVLSQEGVLASGILLEETDTGDLRIYNLSTSGSVARESTDGGETWGTASL